MLLPVERTPETRGRWGMSVGMDWTNHALHWCADTDRDACGEHRVADTNTKTTNMVLLILLLLPLLTSISLSLSLKFFENAWVGEGGLSICNEEVEV